MGWCYGFCGYRRSCGGTEPRPTTTVGSSSSINHNIVIATSTMNDFPRLLLFRYFSIVVVTGITTVLSIPPTYCRYFFIFLACYFVIRPMRKLAFFTAIVRHIASAFHQSVRQILVELLKASITSLHLDHIFCFALFNSHTVTINSLRFAR